MYSVLYVDDEPGLLEITKLFLEREGEFTVDTRVSALEGLSAMSDRRYDAIVADYQMPKMDGLAFLKEVRSVYGNDFPFILFTGKGREEVVIEVINNGADFYVQKGGDPKSQFAELAHKIRLSIERRAIENALHESEERLRFALEGANEGLWDMKLPGGEILISPAGCDILGISAHMPPGTPRNWSDLVVEEDLPAVNRAFSDYHEGRTGMFEVEARPRTRSLALRWVLVRGRAVERDKEGNILRLTGTLADISGRKKAESDLQASRKDWETIFRAIGSPAIIMDTHHRIIDANEALLNATGKTLDEVKTLYCWDIFHPGHAGVPIPGCPMDTMLQSVVKETVTTEVQALGGTYLVSCTPVYDDCGKLAKVLHIATDITESKRMEAALAQSEGRLRLTFDATDEGLWDWNLITGETYLSPRFYTMIGYEPGEFPPSYENSRLCVHPDDVGIATREINDHIHYKPEGYSVEFRMKTKSGGWVWILSRGKVVERDEDGRPVRMVGTHLDISARKQAEEKLMAAYEQLTASEEELREQYDELSRKEELIRESEERYRLLFENANDGIFLSEVLPDGMPGRFIMVNSVTCRQHGYARNEMLQMSIRDIIVHSNPSGIPDIAGKLLREGQTTFEANHRRKDGTEFPAETSIHRFELHGRKVSLSFVRDITERKIAERKVQQSEEKYRLLTEQTEDIIYRIDLTGKILHVSPQVSRYGYNPDDLISQDFMPLVVGEDVPRVFENVQNIVSSRKPRVTSFRVRDARGCTHWMEANASPVFDAAGDVSAISGILRDVTEKKEAQDALAQSEERLRLSLEATDEGLWDWDVGRGTSYLSPRFYTMLGLRPDEFPPSVENFLALVHPDDVESVRKGIAEHIRENQGVYTAEFRMITKSGGVVWILSRGKVVERDGDGRPARIVGTHLDITERKKSQDELRAAYEQLTASEEELREQYDQLSRTEAAERESEERFRTLFESANDAIFVHDENGLITRCNKKALAIFGCARESMFVGHSPLEFSPEKQPDGAVSSRKGMGYISAAFSGTPQTFEWVHVRVDGTPFYCDISLSPVTMGGKRFIQSIARDVSKRKHAEKALQMSESRLSELNSAFLSFTPDPVSNINILTGLAGKMLQGTCALYNRIEDGMLCSLGMWNTPPDFTPCDHPAGHICSDVILKGGSSPTIIPDLMATPYAGTDPNVRRYKLQTYIGIPVKIGKKSLGSLCVVYQDSHTPTPQELEILSFLSQAIATEDERRATLHTLREREDQSRRTFDQSPVGAAITSLDFRYIRVNAALCKLLGYREEELLGKTFRDITHPDDLTKDAASLRRLASGELDEYRTKKRYIRKDGSVVWAQLSSRIVRDPDGKPLYYIPIMVDITAENENRDAVLRREGLLVAINFAAERLIQVHRWTECIGDILLEMGKAASVDRTYIFEFMEKKDGTPLASLRYEWVAPGVLPLIGDGRMQEIPFLKLGLGHLYESFKNNDFFAGDLATLSEPARALFDGHEINSILLVPIMAGNVPWGFIGFNNTRREKRQYLPVEIEALQTAAGIIGSAIARGRYEDELHRSLENGAVLLREVHHRVRNNMQVISSLLSIESASISDKKVLEYLRETESRIKSMALVHEKLYKSDSLSAINVSDYVRSLVSDLISTYAIQAAVSVDTDLEDDILIELERAIPFGLIVHEIVTNSLTHAFPGRESGKISVAAGKTGEGNFTIRIRDDGVGIPEGIDFDFADTLGLQLISMLTRQVDGTITLSRNSGTEFVLTLPRYREERGSR